jgi:hypothetical protein
MDDVGVEQPRKVSWGAVIGGVCIAAAVAIVVTPLSMVCGAWIAEQIGRGPATVAVGAVMAGLVAAFAMWVIWLLARRNRDLGIGVIIGGALVVILSGTCGALLSSFSGASFH